MKDENKVSIVLPTHNRMDLLPRAVNSILNQSYSEFELIIVDDASTDATEELISQLTDSRIRYIHLEKNRGAAGARNEGISHARYDYIAFQDSDDEWLPDKLSRQMKVMKEHPDAGLVYSKYFYHSLKHSYDGTGPTEEIYTKNKSGYIFPFLLLENLVAMPTILARREVFEACGMFREDWKCLEDYELVLRIAKKYSFQFIDEVLVNVYATETCVSNQTEEYFKSRCRLLQMYRQELKQFELWDIVYEELMDKAGMTGAVEFVKRMLQEDMGS